MGFSGNKGCHNTLKLSCAHLQIISFILIPKLGRLLWLLRNFGSKKGNLTIPLSAMCAVASNSFFVALPCVALLPATKIIARKIALFS